MLFRSTDGIVDIAYNVNGSGNSIDYYPIADPWCGPGILNSDVLIATEDQLYSVAYSAFDRDTPANLLIWFFNSNATWLNFSIAQVLYGTPTNDDVGTFWVDIIVTDGILFSRRNFTITVFNVNDPPTIDTTDVVQCLEDSIFMIDYNATDIDPTNDVLTWSLNTNATFFNFNTTSGEMSAAPVNMHVGTYWVNITVSDGNGGFDYTNFTFEVVNTNDDPGITTLDLENAVEDTQYSNDYDAFDMDPTNDIMTWSMTSNCDFLTIVSSTGVLSGTPDNDDVGVYWVNVVVDDGKGGSDFHNFTLTVTNTNDPPNITTSDVLTGYENVKYSVDYNATDIDPTDDTLT